MNTTTRLNALGNTPFAQAAQAVLNALLCCALAACGGGGSPSAGTATNTTTVDALASSALAVGDSSTWSVHAIDDSGSQIDLSFTNAITTVNSDQSYVRTLATVGGPIAPVHGTDYTINETDGYGTGGVLTSVANQSTGRTCQFSGGSQAVPLPIAAGMTWSKQWTKTCSDGFSADVTVTNGHWVAVEQVQTGLGTFTANKVHYVETETPTAGGSTIITTTFDCWFDTAHDRKLKCQWSVSRSGATSSAGYAVTVVEELQGINRVGATAASLPTTGAGVTFDRHLVDSSNSSVDLTFTDTITSVNASANTYVSAGATQGGSSITLNGIDYTVNGEGTYSSTGLQLSYTYKQPTPHVTCSYSQAPQAVIFPITAGLSWANQWATTCSNGYSANVTLTGAFVGNEQITVAAGTFLTNKARFVITETPTTTNPSVITETHTCWYQVLTKRAVKCHVDRVRTGGTATSAYAVSIDDELKSVN